MSVSSYEKNGKTYWKVYATVRSKKIPSLRKQKRIFDLPTEKIAHQKEKDLLIQLMEELTQAENKGYTWEEIVGSWELAMRAEPNRYTWETIMDNVSRMHNWTKPWLKRYASDLNKADGRDCLKALITADRSKGFVKHIKSTINTIFQWGIENRLIQGVQESPVKGLNLDHRREEKLPEVLNLDEIKRLLQAGKDLEHPWYPVWAMALLTGMRNGELYALKWSEVDLENQKILVSRSYNTRMRGEKSTKSGKWRTVPISEELLIVLKELKESDPNREYVLPRLPGWREGMQAVTLRQFCSGIGLKSIRFHALRACFATQLLSNDVAPARVMKVCGWQDLKTMQFYVRLAGVDEKGATDSIRIIPTDRECMDKVVRLIDFKAKKT